MKVRLALVVALVGGLLTISAPAAHADWAEGCSKVEVGRGSNPNWQEFFWMGVEFDHAASSDFVRAHAKTDDGGYWTDCYNAQSNQYPIVAVDIYLATYVDNLVDGQYSLCRQNVNGWFGNAEGKKANTIDQNALINYCNYHSKKIRARGLGKVRKNNGTVISRWAYAPAHNPV